MNEDFSLSDAKFVCAVKELGSSPEVSSLLGLSHSSISVYVQRIEKRIGRKLFLRYKSSTKIDLTADGIEIYPICRKIVDLANSLKRLSQKGPELLQGEIKLTTTQTLLEYFYSPYLVDFMHTHSDISVVIRQLDDMLKMEQSVNEFYFTMEIGDDTKTFEYVPYHDFRQRLWASESYLKKFGTPKKIEDLYQHHLLFQMSVIRNEAVLGADIRSGLQGKLDGISAHYITGSRIIDKLCEEGLGLALGSEECMALAGLKVQKVLEEVDIGTVRCYVKANRSFLSKSLGRYFLDWLFLCRDESLEKIGLPPSYKYEGEAPPALYGNPADKTATSPESRREKR